MPLLTSWRACALASLLQRCKVASVSSGSRSKNGRIAISAETLGQRVQGLQRPRRVRHAASHDIFAERPDHPASLARGRVAHAGQVIAVTRRAPG